jgi:hypothetical protein
MKVSAGEVKSDAAEVAALVMDVPALGIGVLDLGDHILVVRIGPVPRPERGREELDEPAFFLRQLVAFAVRLVVGGISIFPARGQKDRDRGKHCKGYDSATHLRHFDTPAPARQPSNTNVHIPSFGGVACQPAPLKSGILDMPEWSNVEP